MKCPRSPFYWVRLWGASCSLVLAGLLLCLSTARAEDPILADSGVTLPHERSWGIALGDLDGDGDLDLFVANTDRNPSRVWLNDGRGRFATTGQELGRARSLDVALGDLDGDGDLDAFVANWGRDQVWWNQGNGWFAPGPLMDVVDVSTSVALADLDGDGDLDAFVTNWGENRIWWNQGDGAFAQNAELASPPSTAPNWSNQVALGDLDGDGDVDAVVARRGSADIGDSLWTQRSTDEDQATGNLYLNTLLAFYARMGMADDKANQVWWNQGGRQGGTSGAFQVEDLPCLSDPADSAHGCWDSLDVALADLNGDTFPDLFFANGTFGDRAQPDEIWLHRGPACADAGSLPTAAGCFIRAGEEAPFLALREQAEAVATGDLDRDGDLDVVLAQDTGDNPVLVLLNDGAGGFVSWQGYETLGFTVDVAVGDLDGDGALDVVAVNRDAQPTQVFLNRLGARFAPAPLQLDEAESNAAALADLDNDRDLDAVVVGDADGAIWWWDEAQGVFAGSTALPGSAGATGVAVGDLDGDGRLDVTTVGYGPGFVWWNEGARQFKEASLGGSEGEVFAAYLALGDLNNDGALDIYLATDGPDQVWLNDHNQRRFLNSGQELGAENTVAAALGDLDGDGDLDAVTANAPLYGGEPQPSQVWLNDGAGKFTGTVQQFAVSNPVNVALGDLNGDGTLDIYFANGRWSQLDQVWLNDGAAGFYFTGQAFGAENSANVSLGDVDGDGDLDAVLGNLGPETVWLNDGGAGFRLSNQQLGTDCPGTESSGALGDLDGDGDLDAYFANRSYDRQPCQSVDTVWLNEVNPQEGVAVVLHLPDPPAGFHASPAVRSGTIPVTYTIPSGPAAGQNPGSGAERPVGRVEFYYSVNGGGIWQPARNVAGSHVITAPAALRPGASHVFAWDLDASEFFGQSDSVVLRALAYTQLPGTGITNTYRYTDAVPGFFRQPLVATQSFPFRARGRQVRVVDQDGAPLAGALVFRLPAGQFAGAQPLRDGAGLPYRTDPQGYLQGRGRLLPGDRLVALLPITATQPISVTGQAQLYLTSALPTRNGLLMRPVIDTDTLSATVGGDPNTDVVTLTIPTAGEATHPLLLFDLLVALEWDAAADPLFLLELEQGFQNASELLYDVTDGQVALGRVDVFPAKSFWNRADVIVSASNSLRPSAAIGGVVDRPVTDTVRAGYGEPAIRPAPAAYVPGQIHMGTAWDPYGEESGDLGEQWWRALAHELAHHLFFLPDNYLGLKPEDPARPAGRRVLGRVDCKNSFMTSTFDPSYSEFLAQPQWTGQCLDTLAEQVMDRTDWETLTRFYPMLRPPATVFEGPTVLPLDVTYLVPWQLPYRRATLPARYFDLRSQGERVRLPTAQVYLFQTQDTADLTDDVLVALGAPTAGGDRVKVRGAHPGDRLCLFDFGASDGKTYVGCLQRMNGAQVSIPVAPLEVGQDGARWAPEVDVRAVTTRTLAIRVAQALASGLPLQVQVYPAHYPAGPGLAPTAVLSATGGVYAGQIDLSYPAADVAVRVWVDDGSNREAVSQFRLQLPWRPGDELAAPPDFPLIGGPNSPLIGGPNSPLIGGPNSPLIGGPNSPLIGGPNSPLIGGPNSPLIGGPNSPLIGGPNSPLIGGPNSPLIGGPNSPLLGGPNSPLIGGPNSPLIGGPNSPLIGGPNSPLIGGPNSPLIGGTTHPIAGSAPRREAAAPMFSADSQVVIYNDAGLFEPNGIRSLQTLPTPPELADEPWLVPVGAAHAVELEPATPMTRTLAVTYLQRDVPAGYEHTLALYFLPQGATTWERLPTRQFVENLLVADLKPVDGIYAVMSTIPLPALNPGWNALSYPLPDTRPITSALASLQGRYSVVYAPAPAEQLGPGQRRAQEQQPAAERLTTLTALRIRSGPGVTYSALGVLQVGETFDVLARDPASGWVQIECPPALPAGGSAAPCWVSGSPRYSTVAPAASVPTTEDPLAGLQTNVDALEFGRSYWIKIEGDTAVVPYLPPPRLLPSGELPGSR